MIFYLLLIIQQPTHSTLFPYTTLFRSTARVRNKAAAQKAFQGILPKRLAERWLGNHAPDRKSTRLNSSHVASSYAVFCFKKKNQNAALNLTCYDMNSITQPHPSTRVYH